jgi:uncharacterized protein YjiS (DUF1127 family)
MRLFMTMKTMLSGSVVLTQIVRSVAGLAKALKHRREIINLAEFDERMLKDIGLTRSDVDGALAEPLFHNPSQVLVRCAERHARGEKIPASTRKDRPVVPTVMRA